MITRFVQGTKFLIKKTGKGFFPFTLFYVTAYGSEVKVSDLRTSEDATDVIYKFLSM